MGSDELLQERTHPESLHSHGSGINMSILYTLLPILLTGQIPNERVVASISHVPSLRSLKEIPSKPSDLLHPKSHTCGAFGANATQSDPSLVVSKNRRYNFPITAFYWAAI